MLPLQRTLLVRRTVQLTLTIMGRATLSEISVQEFVPPFAPMAWSNKPWTNLVIKREM